jgi:uncharacterized protein YcbX
MLLKQMFVHPLKSGRGIEYSRAYVGQQGLLHDREWLLVSDAGTFMTARSFPQMVHIQTSLLPGGALFAFPGLDPILAMSTVYREPVEAQVWDDGFVAYHGDLQVDAWMSRALGTPCRLLWLGAVPSRQQKDQPQGLSFADGFPYLLVNQCSLDDLNRQLASPVGMRHFRPNLVVSGDYAYQEDEWKRIRIGAVEFVINQPCSRCVLTTVDPQSATKDPDGEPLKTLIRTRQLPEGICFGVNMTACNEGIIELGDTLEVLESNLVF